MHCPQCQHLDCKVIESRPSDERVRRRRQCQACGERFTTMERIEYKYPLVVKKDGQRESYDPAKVMAGFRLACRKRPVSSSDLDAAMDRLGQKLRSTQVGEIPSANLGKMVLEELKELRSLHFKTMPTPAAAAPTPRTQIPAEPAPEPKPAPAKSTPEPHPHAMTL